MGLFHELKDGHDGLFNPLTWVIAIGAVVLALDCQGELDTQRDILDQLTQERMLDGHVVPLDDVRLTTPYLHQRDVIAYEAWGEEETTDSDGSTSTRIIQEVSQQLAFRVEGAHAGRVEVSTAPAPVQYPDGVEGGSREDGDTTWYERILRPQDRVTVLGERVDQRGDEVRFSGGLRFYRGTPAQWRRDALSTATWSLIGALLFGLVAALAIGLVHLWAGAYLQKEWGRDGLVRPRDASLRPAEVLAKLRSLDVRDAIDEAVGYHASSRAPFWLVITALGGIKVLFITWLAARLMPALRSLTPMANDAAVERGGFLALVILAALVAVFWLVSRWTWARGLVRAAVTRGRCSELLFQLLGRLSPAIEAKKPLTFSRIREDDEESVWSVGALLRVGGELRIVAEAGSEHLSLIATTPDGSMTEVVCQRLEGEETWRSLANRESSYEDGVVAQAMADELAGTLRARGFRLVGRLAEVARGRSVRLRPFTTEAEATRTSRVAQLVARESFALPDVEDEERGLWWRANESALWYLAIAGAVILGGPLLSAVLWAGQVYGGWDFGGDTLGIGGVWLIAAPLSLLLPGVFWFESGEFSLRRSRKLLIRRDILEFDGQRLRCGEASIHLEAPFSVHLTREPLAEPDATATMLGVELIQGSGAEVTRLRLSVPLEAGVEARNLPEFVHSGPVMTAADAAEWLWPLLTTALRQHGTPLRWSLERTDR